MENTKIFSQRFSPDPTFVYRRIADDCLLVPIRQQVAGAQFIYVLNPMANRIWELLDGRRTLAEVRDQLLEEFEVGPQELEQDLQEFIQQMRELGSLKEDT